MNLMLKTLKSITPEVIALIAQKTDNIVIITDAEQNILWVNEAFETLSGYTFTEVTGKYPRFLQGKDTDKKTAAKVRRLLDLGKEIEVELLNYHKNGTPYWIDMHIIPLKDGKGKITYFLSLEKDITAQKKYEEQIRDAEHRLDADDLYKGIKDYNYFISPDLKVLAYNRAGEEIVKTTTGKKINLGAPFLDYIPPGTEKTFLSRFNYVLKHKTSIVKEEVDNSNRWMHISYYPVFNDDNTILGVTYSAYDISERKNAEIKLERSEEKLQAIIDSSYESHFFLDMQMNILSFNKVALETAEDVYDRTPKVGENILDLAHSDIIDDFKKNFNTALETNKEVLTERHLYSPKGKEFYFRLSYMPVFGANNKLLGLSFNAKDITESRNTQMQLSESEARLRAIFDNSSKSFYYFNLAGKLLAFNKAAETGIRHTHQVDIALGENMEHYFKPEEAKSFKKNVNAVAETKEQIRVTREAVINGKGAWFEIVYNPVFGEKEKLIGVSMVVEDVTEKEISKQQIIDSEAKLKAVFNNSQNAQYFIDTKGILLAFNNKAQEIRHGIDQVELTLGKPYVRHLPPTQVKHFKAQVAKCITGLKEVLVEREHATIYGIKWYRITFNPVFDATKQLWGVLVTQEDFTNEKLAQLKIAESEFKLRAIYESTLDSNILIDTDFNIISFNAVAVEFIRSLYHINLQEGLSILYLAKGEEKEVLKKRLNKVLTSKVPVTTESRSNFKSGVVGYFKFVYVPTLDINKNVTGISINISDITSRTLHEEQLKDKNKVLQEIAAMQSHGLRRPLANILGLTQIIKHFDAPDELKDVIKLLLRSAEELDSEVHNIVSKTHSEDTDS